LTEAAVVPAFRSDKRDLAELFERKRFKKKQSAIASYKEHIQETVDVDDVDLDAKHLRIRAKGDVPQVKFLKSNLRSLLRRYLAERRRQGTADPALFLSNRRTRISARQVANRIKFWLDKAGIDKDIGPHGLRHTFATHLYAATSDLLVVKRALGHRDISTTEIYTHLVDGALEEALERL